MSFLYYAPPAGVLAESDPTALKIASNLGDLEDAGDARDNLELGDLAVEDRASLREVPAGGDDGDVLTSDGANGYAWEAPAGGGGLAETSITVSTGEIAASGSANVDFGIPGAGVRFLVTEIRVERTAGSGTAMTMALWADDARSTGRQWVIGSEFSSGLTVDPGPVFATRVEVSAEFIRGLVFQYRNESATGIIRATVYNKDGANPATYDVTVYGIPLG